MVTIKVPYRRPEFVVTIPRCPGTTRDWVMSEVPRILLEGPPRAGKTTVASRVVALLRDAGVPVDGFLTQEVRDGGGRVGFEVRAISRPRTAMLAHVDFTNGPRVGRYRVDVTALERIAVPALRAAMPPGVVVVVDEIGRMELASPGFVDALQSLLTRPVAVLATVHLHPHPVTDALKARPDLQRLQVTPQTRETLPARLTRLLLEP